MVLSIYNALRKRSERWLSFSARKLQTTQAGNRIHILVDRVGSCRWEHVMNPIYSRPELPPEAGDN
jgi:hypothetical protein